MLPKDLDHSRVLVLDTKPQPSRQWLEVSCNAHWVLHKEPPGQRCQWSQGPSSLLKSKEIQAKAMVEKQVSTCPDAWDNVEETGTRPGRTVKPGRAQAQKMRVSIGCSTWPDQALSRQSTKLQRPVRSYVHSVKKNKHSTLWAAPALQVSSPCHPQAQQTGTQRYYESAILLRSCIWHHQHPHSNGGKHVIFQRHNDYLHRIKRAPHSIIMKKANLPGLVVQAYNFGSLWKRSRKIMLKASLGYRVKLSK